MNPRERPSAPELSQPVNLLAGALLLSFILLMVTAALVWKSHDAYEKHLRSEAGSVQETVRSRGATEGREPAHLRAATEGRETEKLRGTPAEAETERVHGEQTGDRKSAYRRLFAGVLVLGIFLLIAAVSSGLFTQLAGYIAARRHALCTSCTVSVNPSVDAPDCVFRDLVEQSPTGIFVLEDGRFVYVNPQLSEVFGYAADEMLAAKRLTDLVMPEVSGDPLYIDDAAENRKRASIDAKNSSHYTVRKLRKDGSAVYAEVFRSELDYDGRPAVIGTVLDVTEQHEAQEKHRIMGHGVRRWPISAR